MATPDTAGKTGQGIFRHGEQPGAAKTTGKKDRKYFPRDLDAKTVKRREKTVFFASAVIGRHERNRCNGILSVSWTR